MRSPIGVQDWMPGRMTTSSSPFDLDEAGGAIRALACAQSRR